MIKKFGHDPAHILPDRSQVTMTVPFMAAYARRLVATCHRRGAHAIGGMSAFIPNRRSPEVTERALSNVKADKEREVGLGYHGTWVAYPSLVPVATEVFDRSFGSERANQLDVTPEVEPNADALLDTEIPGAAGPRAGVALNVDVSLRYIEAWLGGRGAVAIDDLMEDAATAEISRSQLWEWVRHEVALGDGTTVTEALVNATIDEYVTALKAEGLDGVRLDAAADVVRAVALSQLLPDFLTFIAGARLS